VLDHAIEDTLRFIQAAAGERKLDDVLAIAAPLLDLVEIAVVGDQGPAGFLSGSVPMLALV
jgi:hypothetical protein